MYDLNYTGGFDPYLAFMLSQCRLVNKYILFSCCSNNLTLILMLGPRVVFTRLLFINDLERKWDDW